MRSRSGLSGLAFVPGARARPVWAWLFAAVALGGLSFPVALVGQRTGPSRDIVTRVLLDNDRVLMVELVYPPGAEAPPHAHVHARTVYVVEGGSLELTPEGGDPVRVTLTSGQALWRPAERHRVRNVGETTVRVVETEVKPLPTPPTDGRREDPPRPIHPGSPERVR